MKLKKVVENWKDFDSECPILATIVQVVFTVLALSLFTFPDNWTARLVLIAIIAIFILVFGIQPSLGFKKFMAIILSIALPIGIIWFIGWAVIGLTTAIVNAFRTTGY